MDVKMRGRRSEGLFDSILLLLLLVRGQKERDSGLAGEDDSEPCERLSFGPRFCVLV